MPVTTEAIINLIAAIPCLISLYLLIIEYKKFRNRQIMIMIIGWIGLLFTFVVEALAYILYSETIYKSTAFFLMFVGYMIIFWVDFVTFDQVRPWKLAVFSFLIGICGYFVFVTDTIVPYTYPNGDPSFGVSGYYIYVVVILDGIPGFLWINFSWKVHQQAPQNLKKYSLLFLCGGIFMTAGPLIVVALRLTHIIPGIDAVLMGLGALMVAAVFVKRPQLGYILPFKAIKLAVVESNSNLILYIHKWAKEEEIDDGSDVEDTLFSGMLFGINHFIRETVRKGEVREIITDEAVMMIRPHEEHPINFVLVATKSTKSLRNAFNHFVNRFIITHSHLFYKKFNRDDYKNTINLIEECFPFIPYYSEEMRRKYTSEKPEESNKPTSSDNNLPLENKIIFKRPRSFYQKTQKFIKKIKANTPKGVVKALKICASCQDIKDYEGEWFKIEKYIQKLSDGQTSWEICPKCHEQKHTLLLSYFDEKFGPQLMISSPKENLKQYPELKGVPSFIELNQKDFFLNTFQGLVIANFAFNLPSKNMRGQEVTIMLSYINPDRDMDEKFAKFLLNELCNVIKNIENIEAVFGGEDIREQLNSKEYNQLNEIFKRNILLIPEKIIHYHIISQE
jgi:hypothetical protein